MTGSILWRVIIEVIMNYGKKKIEKLKKRNLELEPIVSKGFEPFTDELEKHKEKNKAIFDEYFDSI